MSDPIIKVDNLSKSYWIKHQLNPRNRGVPQYERFSEVLSNALQAPFRRGRAANEPNAGREEFWALKDISFEVQRGEVIGIIGRNGAGKSTLLKILSRITEPTTGRIEIDGRVASLLEVGTGFHPELTGRENIFLNGAVLGMSRVEIRRKFDEIVAFAEVEKFLDTPVKRYSSGMYVRLAFAVAAHLEPEVLVVDEVLAVGDIQFQKKCLGKMQTISRQEGRTVLFVSHNMRAIATLCTSCAYLEGGRLLSCGRTKDIITEYLQKNSSAQVLARSLENLPRERNYGKHIQFLDIEMVPPATGAGLTMGDPLVFNLRARCLNHLTQVFFGLGIDDIQGNRLFTIEGDKAPVPEVHPQQVISARVEIPLSGLRTGFYSVTIGINSGTTESLDHIREALTFEVLANPADMIQAERSHLGLYLPSKWTIELRPA
ncbi:MAG TPA: ABC transporter ATP-binding protein [Opitutales bacterium]|nr:ABC transporter ATP-binding protein [Opitutales bacterium]